MEIGIIGLGKLGKPVAEVIATKYKVNGYDVNKVSADGVEICASIQDVVTRSNIIFVAVPTPHHPEYGGTTPTSDLEAKDFDYSTLQEVLDEAEKHAKKDQIISVISTVLPGTMRRLTQAHKKAKIVYNPYLIAMSTVKRDFVDPEMIILGTENGERDWAVRKLVDFYNEYVVLGARYEVGTWEEAESIKIFYNTFISAKVALSNMIMDVANKTGNINVDVVTDAISRSDKRIVSSAYLRAGIGDGGPCHPRDNIALSYLAEKLGLGYDLFKSIMHSREMQAKNLANDLISYNLPVCILGTRYKKNTELEDGSYSLLVSHYLSEAGKEHTLYDPALRTESLPTEAATFLISFHEDWIKSYTFPEGSVIVDPWRKLGTVPGCTVVHYGNTRS